MALTSTVKIYDATVIYLQEKLGIVHGVNNSYTCYFNVRKDTNTLMIVFVAVFRKVKKSYISYNKSYIVVLLNQIK